MKNYERMLQLVVDFFSHAGGPDQITVSEEERELLERIHPATLTEVANEDGPMVWILMVPTTAGIMQRFLSGAITEKELLHQTQPGATYDAIYLCSAFTLPEFRHHGLAKKATIDAIADIRKDHAVDTLFYWPLSEDGRQLAKAIAKECGLPIKEKHIAA